MIKSKIQNMTIKHKLILIIMLTCIFSLVLAGGAFIAWEWLTIRINMETNLSTQAEMIADNCKAAVAFEDIEDAKETLDALRADTSIVFGGIYNNSGELFAYYRNNINGEVLLPEMKKATHGFSKGFLTVFQQINLDGEKIGTVCIRSDLQPMYVMLKRSTKIILAVLLAASTLAYFVSSRLQRFISRPILNVAEVARVVSQKKDYSTRVLKHGNDEIGVLIDAFNEMLEQIRKRDAELVDTNEQLETRVQERTSELTEEIAERKKTEAIVKALNEDLKLAVEKLRRSNRELQDFTYIASHDLQEPLRKISAFGQLIKSSLEGKLTEDDEENLTFMIDGANRMQQLVDALLAYSRVASKAVSPEEVDLNEIITHLRNVELAVKLEETRGSIMTPEPLPAVKGNPVQIGQLLQNLVSNALKYHKEDVSPEVVIKAYREKEDAVRIEVADNGIGIKEEYYNQIFTMFRRVHSQGEYDGCGIGLAICKKIIDYNNGKIGVRSNMGEGSVFWFTLPLAEIPKNQRPQSREVSRTV